MTDRPPIPVHVIAGPLGVGKTTAIGRYLAEQSGSQFIGVLVNDFGPVGLDAPALTAEHPDGNRLVVRSIPGGCLCCVSTDALTDGITHLAAMPGIDRILIEPSGLALPAQVVNLLHQLAPDHRLDVRPTIVLLDAAEFGTGLALEMPYYRRLIESADILVAHRADRTGPAALARFEAWAADLDPPKLAALTAEHGRLPADLFNLARETAPAAPTEPHDTHHTAPHRAGGHHWPATDRFDRDLLRTAVSALGAARFKGHFHTTAGWRRIEWALGELHDSLAPAAPDNRCEWIDARVPNAQVTARLDACRS